MWRCRAAAITVISVTPSSAGDASVENRGGPGGALVIASFSVPALRNAGSEVVIRDRLVYARARYKDIRGSRHEG